ncbi:hypothetical protein ACGGAI_35575 [Streptomyces antibioticus]|uniref:hypothetical protein n=1 Tax=Streptomyces antibioticus TaxID=1890 RepID=UPI003723B62E
MDCEQEKAELAGCALASLDGGGAERLGQHVLQCGVCSTDLNELLSAVQALRTISEQDLTGDWSGRIEGLGEAAVRVAAAERSSVVPAAAHHGIPVPAAAPPIGGRGRARYAPWALAACLAGVLLGIGGAFVLSAPDEPPPQARPAGPTTVRAVSDGISGAVEPTTTGWGTQVVFELSGVRGPQRCSLVAVARDNTRETALTWQVPPAGYGLPDSPKERLIAMGGIATAADQVVAYVVETAAGEVLLTIPGPSA